MSGCYLHLSSWFTDCLSFDSTSFCADILISLYVSRSINKLNHFNPLVSDFAWPMDFGMGINLDRGKPLFSIKWFTTSKERIRLLSYVLSLHFCILISGRLTHSNYWIRIILFLCVQYIDFWDKHSWTIKLSVYVCF